MLFVFIELAALHHRGRCGARFDSGKVRQCKAVWNALRRRSMFGAVGQGRRGDVVRDLCGAARSLPDLHARRSRMWNGAETAWPPGPQWTFLKESPLAPVRRLASTQPGRPHSIL